MDFGKINIKLDEQLQKNNLSRNKFAQRAEMQRTQLNKYLRNDIALLNIDVLARMCSVLKCDISDILEYIPPDDCDNNNY